MNLSKNIWWDAVLDVPCSSHSISCISFAQLIFQYCRQMVSWGKHSNFNKSWRWYGWVLLWGEKLMIPSNVTYFVTAFLWGVWEHTVLFHRWYLEHAGQYTSPDSFTDGLPSPTRLRHAVRPFDISDYGDSPLSQTVQKAVTSWIGYTEEWITPALIQHTFLLSLITNRTRNHENHSSLRHSSTNIYRIYGIIEFESWEEL